MQVSVETRFLGFKICPIEHMQRIEVGGYFNCQRRGVSLAGAAE